MRRLAAIAFALIAATSADAQCTAGDGDWVREACYGAPRTSGFYGHDILGGTPEWMQLSITLGPKGRAADWSGGKPVLTLRQRDHHIFEDVAPRLVQLDGSGPPEIIMVDTIFDRGARLAVYNLETTYFSATPYIGRRNRWLAPIGAADLDGDGRVEIAYIDRPHLAKTLLVWRYDPRGLNFVAELPGVTNHRIGETDIAGGIRDCGPGPEMVVATADWSRVVAVRFDGIAFTTQDLGPHEGRASFAKAMDCR